MKSWSMIRISKATHAKLIAMKSRFDNAELLPADLDRSEQDRFGVSIASIVDWLVLQEEKHKERSSQSKKRPANGSKASQSNIGPENQS